jgi:uncharacterized paraquat-inducible protein A
MSNPKGIKRVAMGSGISITQENQEQKEATGLCSVCYIMSVYDDETVCEWCQDKTKNRKDKEENKENIWG